MNDGIKKGVVEASWLMSLMCLMSNKPHASPVRGTIIGQDFGVFWDDTDGL